MNLAHLLLSDEVKVRRDIVVSEAAKLLVKANPSKGRRQCLGTSLARMQVSLKKSVNLRPVILRSPFVYRSMSRKTTVQCCYDLKYGHDACPSDSAQRMFLRKTPGEVCSSAPT